MQVSRLVEHEITRVLNLISAIAQKPGIKEAKNADVNDFIMDVRLKKLLGTIHKHKKEITH